MPLLVVAATDQTGRTITMLSAGLVAVAFGLTALTIWYWRFTSPRRRATTAGSVTVSRPVAEEPPSVGAPSVGAPPVAASPVVVMPVESAKPADQVELSQPVDPPEAPPPEDPAEPSDSVEPSEWVELWAAGDPAEEPEQVGLPDPVTPPPHTDEPPIGLDSEQWAVLSQAVLDEYLDS